LDSTFGAVVPGNIEGVVEITARMNGPAAVHEFGLSVSFLSGIVDCQFMRNDLICLQFTTKRIHSWDLPISVRGSQQTLEPVGR
jgi:hypothetical protein